MTVRRLAFDHERATGRTDKEWWRAVGWRLGAWVIGALAVWQQIVDRMRKRGARAVTAASLVLLAGCAVEVDETLPSRPPTCACDPPPRVEIEAAPDAGTPTASGGRSIR